MFIKITNDAKFVNRIYLEKLGISTKRDNDQTIGQFGSGSKFAPIAALRNGWRWVSVGEDEAGPYRMEYKTKNVGGFDVVVFDYGDYQSESSYTLDAGKLSWEEPFQIFREAFANALDAFFEFDATFSVTFVDEIEHEDGKFSVYLTDAPELREIAENLDKYFSVGRKPIAVNGIGKMYDQYDGSGIVYHRGVRIGSMQEFLRGDDDVVAMFDYEIDQITLNEERRVRATYQAFSRIMSVISNIDDVGIISKFIRNYNKDFAEYDALAGDARYEYFEFADSWRQAWDSVMGHGVVFIDPEIPDRSIDRLMTMYGRTGKKFKNTFLQNIIANVKIETITDVLGDEVEYDIVEEGDFFDSDREKFIEALAHLDAGGIDYSTVKDWKFFYPQPKQMGLMGTACDGSIKLNYLLLNSDYDIHDLIGTIVHEVDHVVSGLGDDDDGFRHFADSRIADLLIRIRKESV